MLYLNGQGVKMVVAIIAGRGGVGKSSQLFPIARLFQPTQWAILEKKDERSVTQAFSIESVEHQTLIEVYHQTLIEVYPRGHRDKQGELDEYMDDPIETLKLFQQWRDMVLQHNEVKCIVVDGISDLRRYATTEWELINEQKATGRNVSAWTAINARVKRLVNPIRNFGVFNGIHVFFTVQMRDVYGVDAKKNPMRLGEEPDIKEWLEYPMDALLILNKQKRSEVYTASAEKVPNWCASSGWVEELRKDTGLLKVMSTYGLLEGE